MKEVACIALMIFTFFAVTGKPARDKLDWQTTKYDDGSKIERGYISDVWQEEFSYDATGKVMEHRWQDVVGRIHTVIYDESGIVLSHRVRD